MLIKGAPGLKELLLHLGQLVLALGCVDDQEMSMFWPEEWHCWLPTDSIIYLAHVSLIITTEKKK